MAVNYKYFIRSGQGLLLGPFDLGSRASGFDISSEGVQFLGCTRAYLDAGTNGAFIKAMDFRIVDTQGTAGARYPGKILAKAE